MAEWFRAPYHPLREEDGVGVQASVRLSSHFWHKLTFCAMVTIEVARLPKWHFFTDSPLRSSCHGHMIMDDPLRNY